MDIIGLGDVDLLQHSLREMLMQGSINKGAPHALRKLDKSDKTSFMRQVEHCKQIREKATRPLSYHKPLDRGCGGTVISLMNGLGLLRVRDISKEMTCF